MDIEKIIDLEKLQKQFTEEIFSKILPRRRKNLDRIELAKYIGEWAYLLDPGIVNLVLFLWQNKVKTYLSCQGHKRQMKTIHKVSTPGAYIVVDKGKTGAEFCEKFIGVKPQIHKWTGFPLGAYILTFPFRLGKNGKIHG